MKTLLYYYFHANNCKTAGVAYTLSSMRHLFDKIVVVTDVHLPADEQLSLSASADKFVTVGSVSLSFSEVSDILGDAGFLDGMDSLVVMDNSSVGPFKKPDQLLDEIFSNKADCFVLSDKIDRDGLLDIHFTAVNQRLFEFCLSFGAAADINVFSGDFISFIKRNKYSFSSYLTGDGLPDFMSIPDKMLPFLNLSAIMRYEAPKILLDVLRKYTDYPITYLLDDISRAFLPNKSIFADYKNVIISPKQLNLPAGLRVAVVFHVFYVDVFMRYIGLIVGDNKDIDIFISTNSPENKKNIEDFCQSAGMGKQLKEVVVVKNRGRDVLPWLKMSSRLADYDVVGKFHTKKSVCNTSWIGDSWMYEIYRSIGENISIIINSFVENGRLGIVIPDYPFYLKQNNGKLWQSNKRYFSYLISKMNLKGKVDVEQIDDSIMPIGNMFWYRPVALRPLFDLGLDDDDFPAEPIPSNGTIAHAIERLPVYVAWAEGYDFRVAVNSGIFYNGFINKEIYITGQEKNGKLNRILRRLPKPVSRFLKELLGC